MNAVPTHVSTESGHLQKLGVAAAEELRQTVRAALTDVFGKFLRELPPALSEAAFKVSLPSERTAYQDLERSVNTNSARWLETFITNVDGYMIGGVGGVVAARSATGPSSGPDDSIALANIELRAEGRYRRQVTELDARVNRIRLMLYVPIFTKALAPAGLCRSLQDTADALGWPGGRLRRFLFEKFDAMVVPALEGMYRSLIEALTRIGAEAVRATPKPAEPPKKAPRPARAASTMQAPADARNVDADTVSMLRSFALNTDGVGYTDGLLAADLLALMDARPLPGITQDQGWVPLQRITLAGHFLNEVIADPMVPEELKPQHESVRLPLMKSALTDESLFTSKTHPLNSMVNELLLKSAASRVTGNRETRRMAELIQQVLEQFNLAPEFVRQAMQNAQPLQDTQIQRFFELQRQQAQQRRDFVISEAKRMVVKQLEAATFGRGVPPPAVKFLNGAWGPLLTKRLLQHGADHSLSQAANALMEQMLDMLDARNPAQPPSPEWQQLLQAMGKALVAEGMAVEQVKIALASLEAARKAPPGELGL